MFHVTEDRRLKIELILRIAAMVLIALILSVASGLSKVIPPGLQYMLGIMTISFYHDAAQVPEHRAVRLSHRRSS